MDDRPPIPAEIKRRVLVEAGHRCAIPTCRYIEVELHHIIPWATCRTHEYENLIALCANCHGRADSGKIDRKALRLYKLNLRFAHDKYSQLEMDMLFELFRAPEGAGAPWAPYMLIFFKRLIDSSFVTVVKHPNIRTASGGVDTTPTFLSISPKGREFVQELGIHEL
jgi:5-methylcytosine-specific restriction endonuclease McrA